MSVTVSQAWSTHESDPGVRPPTGAGDHGVHSTAPHTHTRTHARKHAWCMSHSRSEHVAFKHVTEQIMNQPAKLIEPMSASRGQAAECKCALRRKLTPYTENYFSPWETQTRLCTCDLRAGRLHARHGAPRLSQRLRARHGVPVPPRPQVTVTVGGSWRPRARMGETPAPPPKKVQPGCTFGRRRNQAALQQPPASPGRARPASTPGDLWPQPACAWVP